MYFFFRFLSIHNQNTTTDGNNSSPQTHKLFQYNISQNQFVEIQSWNAYEKCVASTVFIPGSAEDYQISDIYLVIGNIARDNPNTRAADSFVMKFNKVTYTLDLYQKLSGIQGTLGVSFLDVSVSNKPYHNGFLLLNSWRHNGTFSTNATLYDWIDM